MPRHQIARYHGPPRLWAEGGPLAPSGSARSGRSTLLRIDVDTRRHRDKILASAPSLIIMDEGTPEELIDRLHDVADAFAELEVRVPEDDADARRSLERGVSALNEIWRILGVD
jgi:hypothetical protein